MAAAIAATTLLVAPAAEGSVVTVGNPLTRSLPPQTLGGGMAFTFANGALPEPGAHVTSPVNGTVVAWRITGAAGGPFKLRVLQPAAGGAFTGAGTSAPATPAGTSTQTITTSLPIRAGDLVAIDDHASSDQIGTAAVTGATIIARGPPLADGATAALGTTVNNTEVGFNADVQPTLPSFGKLKTNRRHGTAKLAVTFANPGSLTLAGKGLKTVSQSVAAPGTLNLPIKAKGKARQKLDNTGKAKISATLSFATTGAGTDSEPAKLTLRKKLR